MRIAALLLVIAVIFINGFTDAANAVATTVATKAMQMKQACILSAVMNFCGTFITSCFRPLVAESMFNIVDMNTKPDVLLLVVATMTSVLIWSVAAWIFGIPTSESHALIAALSGCAVSLSNSLISINMKEMTFIVIGMLLSICIGFLTACMIQSKLKDKRNPIAKNYQIIFTAVLSFLHGAQDGQKFLGIMLIMYSSDENTLHGRFKLSLICMCSLVMASGTLVGGKRIVESVGENLVPLSSFQGLISDISTTIGVAVATCSGLPISTTHVKTSAVVGTGVIMNRNKLNTSLIKDFVITWLLTFPGCAFIGYLLTKLLLLIF